MTIRFTCAGCGSLLKIKDELAGTDGKCPKCKTEFVVPDSAVEADSEFELETASEPAEVRSTTEKAAEKASEKTVAKSAETPAVKPAKKQKKASASDDFDPADFLMGGGDGPRRSTPAFEDVDPDADVSPLGVPDRPKKLSKAPTPGGGAAATGTGISASAHAKEMMMKAMDESRAHAGDAPEQETRGGIDWVGYFREFGFKGGAAIVFGLMLTYGLYMFFDGMMGSKLKLPPFGYVSGEVKLDGTPLPGATVYFAPMDPPSDAARKDRWRTSYGITDEKGHYKLIYIQGTEGVAVGKCRVWLDLIGPKGQMIPANYTDGVLQVRQVKPGRNESINFEMKSNP